MARFSRCPRKLFRCRPPRCRQQIDTPTGDDEKRASFDRRRGTLPPLYHQERFAGSCSVYAPDAVDVVTNVVPPTPPAAPLLQVDDSAGRHHGQSTVLWRSKCTKI